ncbi:MAG: hypothetical protein LC754_06680 [Acidobacteria bacterium]|nr:hypothetical protein [Acidobacteriota bacterium]
MTVVTEILKQMSAIAIPQEKFLSTWFATILVLRGRVNFLNLSRYADYSERSVRRHFRQDFDFLDFNLRATQVTVAATATQLLGQELHSSPRAANSPMDWTSSSTRAGDVPPKDWKCRYYH